MPCGFNDIRVYLPHAAFNKARDKRKSRDYKRYYRWGVPTTAPTIRRVSGKTIIISMRNGTERKG
ncbi:MAG: hypothetical protein ACLR56_07930 [Oscillospiraceae bacterium]